MPSIFFAPIIPFIWSSRMVFADPHFVVPLSFFLWTEMSLGRCLKFMGTISEPQRSSLSLSL